MNRRPMHRLTGWCAAVVAALTVMVTAGCGFDVQTLQPYTAADGVNFTLGGGEKPPLKVRNLFIIADDSGKGFVSASMIVDGGSDTLRSITGVALDPNGKDAGAIAIATFPPVAIGSDRLVVLTDLAPISVSGPLKPGLEARLVLTFAASGAHTIVVPVVDAKDPVYAGVTPSPTAATPSS